MENDGSLCDADQISVFSGSKNDRKDCDLCQ